MKKQRPFICNTLYVLKDAATYSKESIVQLVLYILSKLASTLFAAITTYLVVDALSSGSSPSSYLLKVSIICLLSLFFTAINIYSESRYSWICTFARCSTSWIRLSMKSIDTDYQNVEPRERHKLFEKAFLALNGNWDGIEGMMKEAPKLAIGLLGTLSYMIIVAFYVPWVLLIMAGMVLSNFLLGLWANRYLARTRDQSETFYSKRYVIDDDLTSISNAKDIRAYRLDRFFFKTYDALTKSVFKIERNNVLHSFLGNVSDSIFSLVRDLIAYSILIGMVANKQIDISTFSFLVAIIGGFSTWVNSFTSAFNKSRNFSVDVDNYRLAMEAKETSNHGKGRSISSLSKPYAICFDHVSFSYPGESKETIHDLTLSIKPGEKIALVGNNGAGKTTIIKLLCGLYAPSQGKITLNGIDIKEFNIDEYFSLISVLFQDVQPLAFDIETNVSCATDEATDKQRFWKAIENAGLKEKVESLPNKEKTYITQTFNLSGIQLSGGETQKLLLARALYKNGGLLLLDEPTSALDPISEEAMYKKYLGFSKGNTSIFISHRLASTRFCDRILFLKDGSVEAEGNHEELLRSCKDYKEMFDLQARYYLEANHE